MLQKILLVHESTTIRRAIHNYLMSDINDITVTALPMTQKVIEELDKVKYNLIISGDEMTEMDGLNLYLTKNFSAKNKESHFILITSSGSIIEEKAHKAGVSYCLNIPFKQSELADLVNQLLDPKKIRRTERVAIEDASATVHFEESHLTAEVINMSYNGILCEFKTTDILSFTKELHLTILFPKKYPHNIIENVWCKFVSIKVLGWDTENNAIHFRVAWCFTQLSEDTQSKINDVIGHGLAQFGKVVF